MITAPRSTVKRPIPKKSGTFTIKGAETFPEFRGHSPSYTKIDSVIYKVAETRAEREAAFRLIYDAYTASGLISENAFGMRVTSYHLSPMTGVLLATFDHVPTHTVSLIEDAELALPLEELYGDEVKKDARTGTSVGRSFLPRYAY